MAADYGAKGFKELLAESTELLKIMDVAFKINERINKLKSLEDSKPYSCRDGMIEELEWVLKLLGEKND